MISLGSVTGSGNGHLRCATRSEDGRQSGGDAGRVAMPRSTERKVRGREAVVTRLALTALLVVACAGSGLSGRYSTSPGSGYGFEFTDGQTVISRAGADVGRG